MALVALLLLVASTYCSLECAFLPCSEVQSAEQQVPPCHRHSEGSQPERAPQECAHPHFIAEHSPVFANLVDVAHTDAALATPLASVAPPTCGNLTTAAETPPRLLHAVHRSIVLRV
jgi:hypothetical protein